MCTCIERFFVGSSRGCIVYINIYVLERVEYIPCLSEAHGKLAHLEYCRACREERKSFVKPQILSSFFE